MLVTYNISVVSYARNKNILLERVRTINVLTVKRAL